MTKQSQKRTRELLLTNQMLLRVILGRLSMSSDQTEMYECLVCQGEINKEELEDHAELCFGFHPEMGESVLMQKFEQI